MKKKLNKIIIFTIIMLITIMIVPIKAYGLQANKGGTSKKSTTISDFFSLIRGMESPTGTLAVEADTESKKNGIDCHMAKNTEWGTAALMAASIYGAGSTIIKTSSDSFSTTGNESGVYQMGDGTYEYVAGIYNNTSNSYNANLVNADAKYKNNYTSSTPIAGDALECKWGGYSAWVDASSPVFKRSYGGLFGFSNSFGTSNSAYGSRAVVVCAPGL